MANSYLPRSSHRHLPRFLVGIQGIESGALPLHLSPGCLCKSWLPLPLRAQALLGALLKQGDRLGSGSPQTLPAQSLLPLQRALPFQTTSWFAKLKAVYKTIYKVTSSLQRPLQG